MIVSAMRDRLQQARVSVTSPHGIVNLEADRAGNFAVRIPRGVLYGLSRATLEQEIAATIASAPLATPDRAEAQGMSERGYVTVTHIQDGQFQVYLRPRTLRFLNEPELAEEIRTALAGVLPPEPDRDLQERPHSATAAATASAASSPERTHAGMPTPS